MERSDLERSDHGTKWPDTMSSSPFFTSKTKLVITDLWIFPSKFHLISFHFWSAVVHEWARYHFNIKMHLVMFDQVFDTACLLFLWHALPGLMRAGSNVSILFVAITTWRKQNAGKFHTDSLRLNNEISFELKKKKAFETNFTALLTVAVANIACVVTCIQPTQSLHVLKFNFRFLLCKRKQWFENIIKTWLFPIGSASLQLYVHYQFHSEYLASIASQMARIHPAMQFYEKYISELRMKHTNTRIHMQLEEFTVKENSIQDHELTIFSLTLTSPLESKPSSWFSSSNIVRWISRSPPELDSYLKESVDNNSKIIDNW